MKKHLHSLFIIVIFLFVGNNNLFTQTLMTVPTPTSSYSGMTRGYWFTAPCDFTIVGLKALTTYSTANSYIVVLDFGTTPPPVYSTTTNAFTVLINLANVAGTTMIPVNQPIKSGHVIGIMGIRGGLTPYAPNGPYATSIDGKSVTLVRMGMQYDLTTTAPKDLWQEPSATSLGITEMYYSVYNFKADAGVTSVNTPTSPVTPGVNAVSVTITNFGKDTLKKVDLRWSVDGVPQTAPSTWTGSLIKGATAGPISLGNYNFTVGAHVIKAWTISPNGVMDSNHVNDTTKVTLNCCVAANGTYVIDKGATGNFLNFTDAVSWLASCGISGPVLFRVKPGTYNENVSIPVISGVSSTNTITFESFNHDSNSVDLNYSATGTTDNYVIKMNGADYVTFRQIKIRATGTTYGYAVNITGGSDYCTFANNIIQSYPGSTSSYCVPFYTDNSYICNNITIKNNSISGGYYGIYLYGSSTTPRTSLPSIVNNSIKDFYYMGMYIYYIGSPIISSNYIENSSLSSGTTYGIYSSYCFDTMKILKNQINLHCSSSNYGMYLYYSQGTSSTYGLVANNFISINGSSTTTNYGMYEYYCNYLNIYYNSINITTKYASTYALYTYYGTTINVLNNILCNVGTGYAYYMTSTTFGSSNNNDVYSNGTYLGYWNNNISTLGSWQSAASPNESKSLSLNPYYFSVTDLHVYTKPLDSAGVVVSQVKDDIDGEPRNAGKPDIGADEFRVWDNDGGIVSLVSPVAPCAGVSSACIVKLRNFGGSLLKTTKVKWSINGVVQKPLAFSGSLANLKDTALNLGNFTFLKGFNYTLKFWVDSINGIKDPYNKNDSLKIYNYHTALSGTYTIGPSGRDYPSFTAAVNDLINIGVCSSVLFLADSGIYNEHISIPPITGASSINTVTFRSAKGDSNKVTMFYSALGSSDNYLVQLNGANYIRFEKMTLKSTAGTYGYIVDVRNAANYNIFKSCVLTTTSASSSASPVFFNSSSNNNYNLFDNNIMSGGYYGVYMYGYSSTAPGKGNMFRRNLITGFYYYGMIVYYQDSVEINMNKLTSPMGVYGIYFYYVSNSCNINANQLYLNYSGSLYGFYMYYCSGKLTGSFMVTNNMISLYGSGTGTAWGIYSYYGYYNKFYHNSINIACGSTTNGIGIYCSSSSTGTYGQVDIQNNIISNTGGGYTIYIDAGAATLPYLRRSNYNDLYTAGTYIGHFNASDALTLISWQTISSQDPKSFSILPPFVSSTDLHLTAVSSFIVSNYMGLLTDVDGDLRSNKIPVIGADENVHFPNDASIHGIVNPLKVSCVGPVVIKANVYNYGTNNLDSAYVDYLVNGVVKKTIKYKGPLGYLTSAAITIGIDTFSGLNPIWIKIRTRLPNGVADQQPSNDADSVFVKLYAFPVIKSTLGDTICKGDTATLRVFSDNSKIFAWYDSNTAGNIVSRDSIYNTSHLSSSKTYWVEAGTGGNPVSLTTGNGTSLSEMGNMFNIKANTLDIIIDSFAVHTSTTIGSFVPIALYYKVGTYVGSETNPAAWTMVGIDTIISKGPNKFTDVSLGGVRIKKGQTFGFYISSTDATMALYSTSGSKAFTDPYITLSTGTKTFYPFDYLFTSGMSWNGILYYETGSVCSSARVPVKAFVLPVPNPKLGKDTSVCNGKSKILDAGAGIGFHYDWRYGSGSKTISTSQTIKVDSSGNYRVIVTDNCGFLASDTLKFAINPLPVPQFSVNNMNQCLGGNDYIFTNTSSIKSGKLDHFIWNLGDGTMKTDTNPVYSYKTAGTYLVKLKAYSTYGCLDSFSSNITLFPQPTVTFLVNNNRQCLKNNQFKFTNNSTIGSGSIIGQTWYFGDAKTNTSKNPNHSYTTDGLFNINLVSTSDKGCKDSFQLSATVLSQPIASYTVDDSSQCFKTNLFKFINHSAINTGTMTYEWDLGDGTHLTTLNCQHTYGITGSFSTQLVAVSDSGCIDTIHHFVYIIPNPVVNLGKDTTLYSNQSISLDAGPGDNYLWSNNATTQKLVVDTTGIGLNSKLFWVTVTKNGCDGTDTIKITFKNGVGIMQSVGGLTFKLYPNPVNSVFYFEATGLEGKPDLIISDMQGKVKAILHLIPINGTVHKQIDISELANGVYILKVNNGSEVTIGRIIKN